MAEFEIRVTLTVVEGVDHGYTVELDRSPFFLGRSRADFVMTDKKVSSIHACFEIEGKVAKVVDENSTNGIILNGQKVRESTLNNLDMIEIGFSKIRVNIVENLKFFKEKNLSGREDSGEESKADINAMINEELSQFSKWDLSNPSLKEVKKSKKAKYPYGLLVRQGLDRGKELYFDREEVIIGRSNANFVLKDTDVSRTHAIITIDSNRKMTIKDMNSTNGTYVNKKKISQSEIKVGDLIQVGQTLCEVVLESE
ncbi:MAG: FHA domain-containing protein [Bdellovibrionales bacterium]|nr:FHA domain-containing protein [Bdellovibrionales bacterium]